VIRSTFFGFLFFFTFFYFSIFQTPEQITRISEMTKTNFMFQSLSHEQRTNIFQVITLRDVKAGENIIREGEDGDEMYLIDDGHFDVLKKNEDGVSSTVFTYTTEGAAFGELSLMYGKPRAASVRAKTSGRLWVISRLAFRAVLMKKKSTNLLINLRALPFFEKIPVTKLQQLADQSVEESFADQTEVASKAVQVGLEGARKWVLLLVLQGSLKVLMADPSKKGKKRDVGMCFGAVELEGENAQTVLAAGATKLVRISEAAFKAVLGYTMSVDILSRAAKRPGKYTSIFQSEDRTKVNSLKSDSQFKMINSFIGVGDYGYIATFANKGDTNLKASIKIISKRKVCDAKMDRKLVQERNFLAAMRSPFLSRLVATYQDASVVQMIFDDVYEYDLAYAMSVGISATDKVLFAACLFSAVRDLHEYGVFHRFLNPSSVYISASRGVPVLADLRCAKEMDGSKAFTICGDPLFFAPEIVGQTGYDFGVDYWALGVLLFEMFEENSPFGNADTEETALFRAITSYQSGSLQFSHKTPSSAQKLIFELLQTKATARVGYAEPADVQQHAFFQGLDFKTLASMKAEPLDSTAAIDASVQIDCKGLPPTESALFANF
jgi:cGMP-dependent protein kinase 1